MSTGGIEPGSIDRASSKSNLMETVSGVDSAKPFRDPCGTTTVVGAFADIVSAVGSLSNQILTPIPAGKSKGTQV